MNQLLVRVLASLSVQPQGPPTCEAFQRHYTAPITAITFEYGNQTILMTAVLNDSSIYRLYLCFPFLTLSYEKREC